MLDLLGKWKFVEVCELINDSSSRPHSIESVSRRAKSNVLRHFMHEMIFLHLRLISLIHVEAINSSPT